MMSKYDKKMNKMMMDPFGGNDIFQSGVSDMMMGFDPCGA